MIDVDNNLKYKKMKKIILVIFLIMISKISIAQHTLPDFYLDFQENLSGTEIMYKSGYSINRQIFTFESLLLGDAPDLTQGVALELTQIEGTITVTIPLANLATYMASVGRPLQTTVQVRQECLVNASNPIYNDYFDHLRRDMYVVERNVTTQIVKITKVFCTNDFE